MVEYRVLYYPDFSPDSTWLRRILLLSDKVIRIVPADVTPDDPDNLRRLQDVIPECLTSVAPEDSDVAVESGDAERLERAFQLLGKTYQKDSQKIEITVSSSGGLSVAGHVFVHDSKLSKFVQQRLKANRLLVDALRETTPSGRFILVRKDASNIILAGLASRIAGRLGVDAITDLPIPFAVSALRGVPQRAADDGAGEGALLSAVATLMIPASIATLSPQRYLEIRESYAEIREAFKGMTTELAARHRLRRGESAEEFARRVDTVARDFARQYREYRSSRYARRFRSWTPLCVGGVLSVPAAFVHPLAAAGLAVATFAIQVVEKCLGGSDNTADQRVFHMLAGLRRDIVKRSGIKELV